MHSLALAIFSFVAVFWVLQGWRIFLSARNLPWVHDFAPAEGSACPSISLMFAARDEEEKLPTALATLAALDYPRLDIIGVDDRSRDATGRMLDEFAAKDTRIRAVHVSELPSGWLGKPHALQKAYEVSTGEWLLFTDADVNFEASLLRRVVALASGNQFDHLTLLANVEMHGFWETTILTFFGLTFHLANQLDRVNNPKTKAYAGIGAFQLVRRSVYEEIGTHRRLAMEVVDDMKIGKLVKQHGFRSQVGVALDFVSVRWHAGLGNIIRGVTKNFFAALSYSLPFAVVAIGGMLLLNVTPFIGVLVGHGWIRGLSGMAVACALLLHAGVDLESGVSPLYALTYPIGAVLFCYMIVRSVAVTLWKGGVTWRDTFYPLKELRKGVV